MQMTVVKNDLFDYKNRYIYQLEESFKFSLDSILLSEYVKVNNKDDVIVDLCTGLAPLPLILSTKYKNNITCFEIQKEIYDLANKSIKYNNLENQIIIHNDDIKNINDYFNKKSVDIVTCNPPYFKLNKNSIINDDKRTFISRHEYLITLENIFVISKSILKDNGKLYMVHRPERLDEIIVLANKYNVNVKEIVNVITNERLGIKTVLVKCVKNSKLNVKVKAVNIFDVKSYKNVFEEL